MNPRRPAASMTPPRRGVLVTMAVAVAASSIGMIGGALWREHDPSVTGAVLLAILAVAALTAVLFLWRRRLEAAEIARRAAEDASRAKSDFLALMSHELRTPLNTVLGFAEMIRDRAWGTGPQAEERYIEYAGDIHAAGIHLLDVLNDVLDLAKIEAGRMCLSPEPVDAADLAQACLRLNSGQARASGVTVSVEVVPGTGALHADPRAAKQMVVNLLSNACKFTARGGTVRLEVRGLPDGGVLLAVSDTGVGMTAEEITTALQRFGQVDNLHTRQNAGTGLGLPLVKGLIELHGGALAIASVPGDGTTVTLTFPPAPRAA
ncbi:MAG TPA: HAMP domain-containing sensor histidine kinase [Azospirillum sp.]